jgi:hypothetical protein
MMRPSQWNRLRRTASIFLVLLTSIVGLGTATAQPAQQAPGPHVSSSPNGLVINEVADSQTPAQEYFELYNTGAANINLSTYVIYDHDGNDPLSTLDDTNIAPGQIRAIGPTQLHVPQIGATGLARTDFLGLVNTSPSDVVIDVVNWGGAPDISWPNYDRFASYFFTPGTQPVLPQDDPKDIQRWPDGNDTDQGSDWKVITRSPGTFSCDDPYENDNDLSHAVNQNINSTVEHRICPAADSDYVAISMSSAYTYTLQAIALGTSVDLATRLYDTNGNILVEDNPSGTRNSTINFGPSTAGIYKVQIYDANNGGNIGPDWLYNFIVTQHTVPTATPTISTSATPTPAGCGDQYEPDNNIAQAKNIDLNTEQVHTLAMCTPGADVDFVRFAVNGGKVYTLYTKDLSGPVDTVITLYDSAGHAIDQNDDCTPGQGLYSCLDHVFPGTGVYYLRIQDKRGLNNPSYHYTVGFSSTGELPPTGTPTVTPTENPNSPTPTTGPCEDAYEPDGVAENASLILINDPNPQHHSICPQGDADWSRFYARAGKEYTIQTSNLGPGLDTFMFLFDSDMATILAQNDDGGNGLASRIDFFPQRDGWYYVQVKNAGDLGLPEMTYDLSLSVVPGVPQPPGTATPIIAPIETVTGEPNVPTPTTLVGPGPTNPPIPTPTQGSIPPTPAAESIRSTPSAVPTGEGASTQGQPPENTPAKPTAVPTRQPTQAPVQSAPTSSLPGVPDTGSRAPVIVAGAAASGVQPPSSESLAPMLFRVFYDSNKNDAFDTGEGIRGIGVYFLDTQNNLAPTGSVTTSQSGSGNVVQIPLRPQRVYVPYLDLSMPLTHFPERELHSLWLPPVKLPTSVP